ncbi:unnamed protein product [Nesidiocoris tenuis]|uniref:Uncharacterized protein n=1 Tax=Nesidiocoris tenuis TaxID=355587 RepID=A0A6H5GGT6_9HEMI|nr:unnamed protein product [Nesidiocoris tenuis]
MTRNLLSLTQSPKRKRHLDPERLVRFYKCYWHSDEAIHEETATIPMVPYVTTLNFHDVSNVHVQVRNWRYEISPLRRRSTRVSPKFQRYPGKKTQMSETHTELKRSNAGNFYTRSADQCRL